MGEMWNECGCESGSLTLDCFGLDDDDDDDGDKDDGGDDDGDDGDDDGDGDDGDMCGQS